MKRTFATTVLVVGTALCLPAFAQQAPALPTVPNPSAPPIQGADASRNQPAASDMSSATMPDTTKDTIKKSRSKSGSFQHRFQHRAQQESARARRAAGTDRQCAERAEGQFAGSGAQAVTGAVTRLPKPGPASGALADGRLLPGGMRGSGYMPLPRIARVAGASASARMSMMAAIALSLSGFAALAMSLERHHADIHGRGSCCLDALPQGCAWRAQVL